MKRTRIKSCRKCGGHMKIGKALIRTLDCGTADFPGQTDTDGQTHTLTGPAKLIHVWKCVKCGHSVSI